MRFVLELEKRQLKTIGLTARFVDQDATNHGTRRVDGAAMVSISAMAFERDGNGSTRIDDLGGSIVSTLKSKCLKPPILGLGAQAPETGTVLRDLPSVFPCRVETPLTLIPFAPQFTAVCLEVLV